MIGTPGVCYPFFMERAYSKFLAGNSRHLGKALPAATPGQYSLKAARLAQAGPSQPKELILLLTPKGAGANDDPGTLKRFRTAKAQTADTETGMPGKSRPLLCFVYQKQQR